jgi:hypothetical protein
VEKKKLEDELAEEKRGPMRPMPNSML